MNVKTGRITRQPFCYHAEFLKRDSRLHVVLGFMAPAFVVIPVARKLAQ